MITNICDLHSDTLYEIIKNGTTLESHHGHISLEKLSKYDSFIQVLAMWSDKKLTPDGMYDAFLNSAQVLEDILANTKYRVRLAKNGNDIVKNENEGYSSFVYAVEGADLLEDKLSRLETLFMKGVRILTLVWKDTCSLGGAHNNDIGFTEFGLEVIRLCLELGITVDVSHANARQIDTALELGAKYNKPVIASHSNSAALFNHSRNLSDEHYKMIAKNGGVVGVSMADIHLAKAPDINDFARHLCHYYSINPDGVCLGCDFDGSNPPNGVNGVSDLTKLENILVSNGLTQEDTNKIMYKNARDFLVWNLGKR